MADEATERITILLQARDRDFQRVIDRNNKLIAKMASQASRNTTAMARTIDNRLSEIRNSVVGFGSAFVKGLGAGVITAAFAGISNNIAGTIRGVAAIGDEAKRAGLSAQAFQEWKFVAEQNRIGVDQMIDGFKELSLRADEFVVTGAGPAAESLRRLGYDAAELRTKLADPSALMLEMIDRMRGLDQAAQIRVADELFGGSAGERFVELLGQGATGISATIAQAHEAGAVMDSEMIAKAADLDRRFQAIQTTIANTFKSAIVSSADFFLGANTAADLLAERFDSLAEARAKLGSGAVEEFGDTQRTREQIDAVDDVSAAYDGLYRSLNAMSSALSGDIASLFDIGLSDEALQLDALITKMEQLVVDFEQGRISAGEFEAGLAAAASQASETTAQIQAINGVDMSGAISVIGALVGALNVAKNTAEAVRAALPGTVAPTPVDTARGRHAQDASDRARENPTFAPESSPRPRAAPTDIDFGLPAIGGGGGGAGGGGGGGGRGGGLAADDYAREVAAIREKTAALEAEAISFIAVAESGGRYANALEYARKRAELLHAAQQQGKAITPELTAEVDALAAAYVAAAANAEQAADRLRAMEDQAKRGADAITDIFTSVLDGSASAKDALASLLMQMAKVQAQNAIMQMANGGGGGFFSWLGGMLTPARAGGGPVKAGQPYLVNENTPNSEIMVPSRSGGVLNVAQAKDALRGGGGGAVEIVVRSEPGVVVEIARNEAGAVVRGAIGDYDRRILPVRLQQVSKDTRRRG